MSADGSLYATRREPALERPFFKPFQEFVFNESPEPSLALSERMSWHLAKTRPTHQSPTIHLDKGGGLLSVQDADLTSIRIRRLQRVISRIFLNCRCFHRIPPIRRRFVMQNNVSSMDNSFGSRPIKREDGSIPRGYRPSFTSHFPARSAVEE